MHWSRALCAAACVALLAAVVPAHGAVDKDALKSKDLTLSGSAFVVPEEAAVLDGMTALRKARKDVEADNRARAALEARVNTQRAFLKTSKREFDGLQERLVAVRDVTIHNRMVTRMNMLIVKAHEAADNIRELEEQSSKTGSGAQTKFYDLLISTDEKAQAATAKYATLAHDPAVRTVIDKANAGAATKVALGPSPEFTAALGELKKWRADVETEAIPLTGASGVQWVDVQINGEPHKMVVDTGAGQVTLPAEVAAALKIEPGPQDPVVHMRIADGNIIEGKMITLKSVRVGRFTVENVSAIVLQSGLHDAPSLLGDSFLSHFVVKLDQRAHELHLMEMKEGEKKPASTGVPSIKTPGGRETGDHPTP